MEQTSPIEFKLSFMPVIIMSFIRCFSLTLMGMGLPNYVIFDLHGSTFAAGLVLLAYYFPYSLSSIFLTKFSDRIGRKNALYISVIGTLIIYFCYIIPFNLTLVYIASAIEGTFTGMFWPNLEGLISDIKEFDDKFDVRIKQYNYGWNVGTIFGFLVGAISVFFIRNNRIVFFFAASVNIPLLLFLIKLKIPSKNQIENLKSQIRTNGNKLNDIDSGLKSELNKINHVEYAKISIFIIIFLVIFHNLIYNSVPILISAKFLDYSIESYLTYVLAFIKTTFSTIFVMISEKITLQKIGRIGLIFGILECLIMISLGFYINIWFYAISSAVMGVTGIVLYTCGLKLVLEKNSYYNVSLYAGVYEGLIGLMFAIAPVVAGWGAQFNYDLVFILIGSIGIVLAVLYFLLFNQQIRKKTIINQQTKP